MTTKEALDAAEAAAAEIAKEPREDGAPYGHRWLDAFDATLAELGFIWDPAVKCTCAGPMPVGQHYPRCGYRPAAEVAS